MTAPGPPALPLEVKRRRGTLRPDRLPGGGAGIVEARPINPEEALGLSVREVVRRVLETGAPWLAESDVVTIVLLREALDFYADLRDDPRSKPFRHHCGGQVGQQHRRLPRRIRSDN